MTADNRNIGRFSGLFRAVHIVAQEVESAQVGKTISVIERRDDKPLAQ